MTESIFDLVNPNNIAAYWETIVNEQAPYLGETLFPNVKQTGMEISWLKGASGSPVALNPSAFDTNAVPRTRKGLSKLTQDMAFFKESTYIDERLRQQLLLLQYAPDQTLRDTVIAHIFDDDIELIKGAALRREIIRMEALTTGSAYIVGNGVNMGIDYQMPADNKVTVKTAWSDAKGNPFDDIVAAQDAIANRTGASITRAVMNRATWNTFRTNNVVKSTLLANNANKDSVVIPNSVMTQYLDEEYGIAYQIYDKGYNDKSGKFTKFMPDGEVAFLPDGDLGNTHFGTTPEEADLMASSDAQVRLVDTGVAVTTSRKVDPVTVQTKVSMLSLPSFEAADSVYLLDTTGTGSIFAPTTPTTPTSPATTSTSK